MRERRTSVVGQWTELGIDRRGVAAFEIAISSNNGRVGRAEQTVVGRDRSVDIGSVDGAAGVLRDNRALDKNGTTAVAAADAAARAGVFDHFVLRHGGILEMHEATKRAGRTNRTAMGCPRIAR